MDQQPTRNQSTRDKQKLRDITITFVQAYPNAGFRRIFDQNEGNAAVALPFIDRVANLALLRWRGWNTKSRDEGITRRGHQDTSVSDDGHSRDTSAIGPYTIQFPAQILSWA